MYYLLAFTIWGTVFAAFMNKFFFFLRPASTNQSPAAKRSLVLPNHSTPFKKVRSSLDYGGWNKLRPSTLTQPQPPLQGWVSFSSLTLSSSWVFTVFLIICKSDLHFRFSNLGNTCYMNAILQSLFSLPSFSNDLLKQGIQWKRVPMNALLRYCYIVQFFVIYSFIWLPLTSCIIIVSHYLIRRFAHLLLKKDISSPEVKKDLLRRVKNAISSTAERFSGYMQNVRFISFCSI